MRADDFVKDVHLTDRALRLREDYFRAVPEICIERPSLITQYCLKHGLFARDRISILDKANTYREVLEKRRAIVRHERACQKNKEGRLTLFGLDRGHLSLFAGSTTGKFKGVPLYPEFLALTLWPELGTISSRQSNPYYLTGEEARALNRDVFPYWMEHSILELARRRCFQENQRRLGETQGKRAPEIELLERIVFFLASKPNCISHTIPDFSRALKVGLRGIIGEANEKKDRTSDTCEREFYEAIATVLEGIINYSSRLAVEAEHLAQQEQDPTLKKELLDLAHIHRKVPAAPAETFREGLTTIWMCWVALHLENPNVGLSLGRLDQVLYPLYRQDVDDETLTREKAVELLCCLWLKIGDHVPTIADAGEQLFGGTGSNQAITIGGVDQEGKDAVNELTYAILRATELMKLRDPNLNARYCHGVNSQEYLRRLCEVNMETGATPALHNDRAVIKALTAKGESEPHARDYGIIGCVEPCSNGRTYSHSGSILLNLTAVLELTLFNGRHRHTGEVRISEETGDPTTFASFADFQHAFAQQVSWMAERTTTLNNLLGRVHQDFYPTPILSAFFEGPLEKGKDVIHGGATINASGVTIIGLADVADSISAIRKVVLEDRELSFAELLKALEANFDGKGYESLQRRLMDPKRTPKYGNEDALADGTVLWLAELLDQEFGKRENYRGGKYRVGYWTMTNHAGYARLTKALPSGRKSYENFASGITPVSGVTPYLPQTLNSVARLPARYLANGVALNLKFTPEEDKERMLDAFVGYVQGYFGNVEERTDAREDVADRPGRREDVVGHRDGGMEIQFNIVTHDTLVEAARHPERYPELLVRVSGYTAYFKDLNPRMQKEIIDRTEYKLLGGGAVPYQPFPLPSQGS